MKFKIIKNSILSIILPFCGNALAQQNYDGMTDWYIGIGAGVANYEFSSANTTNDGSTSRPFGWEAYAGYRLSEYFNAEIGYRYLDNNHINTTTKQGFTLSLLASFPIKNNFFVFGEVGAIDQIVDDNELGGISPFVGVGAGYQLTPNINIQGLYRRYENLSHQESQLRNLSGNYFGLRVNYRFGQPVFSTPEPLPAVQPKQIEVSTTEEVQAPNAANIMAVEILIADSDGDGIADNMDLCPNTPSSHEVDKDGCTEYIKSIKKMNIDAKFAFNSAKLSPNAYQDLAKLARFMRENPKSIVQIRGYASLDGNSEYNQILSTKRAQAAANALSNKYGISRSRISAKGYGSTNPIIAKINPEANKINRRIEAEVSVIVDSPLEK